MELELFKYGAYLATTVVGWFVGIIWNRQEKQKEAISELKEHLPINYVRRDEFREVIQELKLGFREAITPVLTKLDRMEQRIIDQEREFERTFIRKPE